MTRPRRFRDGRMPNSGVQARNTAPRFNNGPAAGRRTGNGQGTPGSTGTYANFPAPQPNPPPFLPLTPQFEAGRRGLDDQYQANKMNLLNQQALIKPQFDQQMARLGTDEGFSTNALKESMAGRGITLDSTPYTYTKNRDIEIPYGRERSDLATWAGSQMANIGQQLSGADLSYNQGLTELLLNRAADAAANIPMNVPQYSTGRRELRGQRYNNRPQRNQQQRPRRNRGR